MKLLFLGTFGENRQNQGAFCNFSLISDKVGVNAVRGESAKSGGSCSLPADISLGTPPGTHSRWAPSLLYERWKHKTFSKCAGMAV